MIRPQHVSVLFYWKPHSSFRTISQINSSIIFILNSLESNRISHDFLEIQVLDFTVLNIAPPWIKINALSAQISQTWAPLGWWSTDLRSLCPATAPCPCPWRLFGPSWTPNKRRRELSRPRFQESSLRTTCRDSQVGDSAPKSYHRWRRYSTRPLEPAMRQMMFEYLHQTLLLNRNEIFKTFIKKLIV